MVTQNRRGELNSVCAWECMGMAACIRDTLPGLEWVIYFGAGCVADLSYFWFQVPRVEYCGVEVPGNGAVVLGDC